MGVGTKFGTIAETGNNIQTNGLVDYWDAAYKKSYISGSTSTYNLASGSLTPTGSLINDTGFIGLPTASWDFDGVDDYIDLGVTPIVTSIFSISLWVKRSATSGGDGTQVIIGKDGQTSNRVWNIYFNQSTGRFSFWVSSTGAYSVNYRCDTSTAIDNTNWHYLAFINNGDGVNNQIFIDGSEASYTSQKPGRSTLYNTTAVKTSIGSDAATGTTYAFLGDIANVKVYNRALSAADVLQNYNAGKDRFGL